MPRHAEGTSSLFPSTLGHAARQGMVPSMYCRPRCSDPVLPCWIRRPLFRGTCLVPMRVTKCRNGCCVFPLIRLAWRRYSRRDSRGGRGLSHLMARMPFSRPVSSHSYILQSASQVLPIFHHSSIIFQSNCTAFPVPSSRLRILIQQHLHHPHKYTHPLI